MKKVVLLFMTALFLSLNCICAKGNGAVSNRTIELHRVSKNPELIHRAPEMNPLIMECNLIEEESCLFITSNKEVDAEVVLYNQDNNTEESCILCLSCFGQELYLMSRGHYQIVIEINEYTCYVGEFVY